ncbi:hypothetical protein B0O95_103206 [Mycetohabitans endofungorum]|uniref:Uncharacterized protein n=1 Tax=Mycetohabitans endofungorum TaxID=417203 RepID=A0A2P5KCW6_9BURK|nr:hypothetical protein B0O95_103206 [Mycetohabitans endofungorum]
MLRRKLQRCDARLECKFPGFMVRVAAPHTASARSLPARAYQPIRHLLPKGSQ